MATSAKGRLIMTCTKYVVLGANCQDEAAMMAAFNGPWWLIGARTTTPAFYLLNDLPWPSSALSIKYFFYLF